MSTDLQTDVERVRDALLARGATVLGARAWHGVTVRAEVDLLQRPGERGIVSFTLGSRDAVGRFFDALDAGVDWPTALRRSDVHGGHW